MKICVIGAGVVGCATAYQLCREGHEVVLLDRAGGPGTGTSLANGAQLSYSYVEPLASPATLSGLPAMLWNADSPLRLRPRWDVNHGWWGMRFLAACTSARARRGTLELLRMAALSRAGLDQWMTQEPLDIGLQRNGKLVLCPDARSLDHQARQVKLQAEAGGAAQELLDRRACLAREPALAGYEGFVGGVWTASECSADPYRYCQALVQASLKRGLQLMPGVRATRFAVQDQRVLALQTDAGTVQAQAYVLATGIDAPELAAQLGERLCIVPIKGYSLTLAVRSARPAPASSVTDLGRKLVLAPLNGRLRVAAMAEIVGHDLSIPQRRIEQIAAAVEAIYPGLCEFSNLNAWTGLRPATPDSVPIVRQSCVRNAFLNVGHGALGFTLAAGCALRVANAVRQYGMDGAPLPG